MTAAVPVRAAHAGELWRLERGATVEEGAVRFSVWAPRAKQVRVVVGEGSGAAEHDLQAVERGVFEGRVAGLGGGADYRYRLDDADPLPDPVSRWQPAGVHGPSRVVDPGAFAWTDAGWRGLPMRDMVIYELHVGTFSPKGTFDGVIPRLGALKELGVTALEIMPVAEFPGGRNWGYDGVHPYATQSTYGGPDGLRRLVDAAHGEGLAVILDVVYNHLGPEGNYLGQYGPYFTERYRTPWGGALNYDDAESDEVRRYFIDNALHWVTEYHLDGLRLDAVHAIYDFGARHVLEELASAVREQGRRLGREVVVIGESDLNDPRVVRPADRGGWGLDAQWSDDFHHAVHAALTRETDGYYADFGSVAHVAKALRDRFVYDGCYSAHRRRRHGAPCVDVPGERFVVCIQNHDQVGNRASGERLSALLGFDQQKLAAALMLLAPYVPMLFMGEEYGEANPFQYFVSHGDAQLVAAVREGRREEFEAFGWGEDVPDPQSEETFARSRLDPDAGRRGRGGAMRALYRDLLALRRREPALRPGSPVTRVDSDEGAGWLTMLLGAPGQEGAVFAAFNFSGEPRDVPVPEENRAWAPLVDTAAAAYAEAGRGAPPLGPLGPASRTASVGPHSARAWRAGGAGR